MQGQGFVVITYFARVVLLTWYVCFLNLCMCVLSNLEGHADNFGAVAVTAMLSWWQQ